jgi:hypothetical protein
MQLELGFTDLFSLEPVDECNRKFSDKYPTFIEYIKAKNLAEQEQGQVIDLDHPD